MPHPTIRPEPQLSSADSSSDLRRRKRIRTKYMVQTEALRLFADKGYHQTSVDEIAHAAAISPRTFFRYFPCKEDVVLWDEYDEFPVQELWQTHPGEDPYTHLIRRVRELIADIYLKDPERLLARTRLSYTVPDIRARFIDQQLNMIGPYYAVLADTIGGRDDLPLAVTLAALYSATLVALERWQRHDGREDLLRLIDDAIAALAAGATDLRDTVWAAEGAGTRSTKPKKVTANRKPPRIRRAP